VLRRILWLCLLCATSTLSHAQGADWFYLQGDKDTVKLLWAPYEWLPDVQGFNVKRRVPGGTWKTLNSRPILPTYFPEDIETRTNDPALREELRKFHQRVSESEPPKALPAVLSEFADYSKYQGYSKYRSRRDAVLGAYRQALLFGFAYQDAKVPEGGTYEYALYPVMSDGTESELPVAARIWKWGSVPSLEIPFGKPKLAPNTVESKMRISWPVEHAVLERNLVRHVRIYYVNAEGKKTLWTRKGVEEVKYLHAINVDLTGLGERGAVSFSAVPINYFDLEGTPSESISYDWDKYREAVMQPGPAVTNAPPPPAPPPPPPRVLSTSARITRAVHPDKYYPADARRRGEQGAPIVRVCVGPSGALLREPVISESSGFPALDAAGIEVAKAMRYAAGVEGGAAAAESCVTFKVKFLQSNK
jgi:TonB family protein